MTKRYSMVNSYYFCPKKYELQYLLGIEPEDKSLDLEFGTAVHAAIAAHFAGKDAVDEFKFLWSMVDETISATGRYGFSELGSIGEIIMGKWVKSHASKYKPFTQFVDGQYQGQVVDAYDLVEKRISFNIGKHALGGTPDFIGYYDSKLTVVDWKTSAYSYDKRKALVDEQVWVYVAAIKQVYGLDIEQVVYAPLVKDGAKVQNPIVCAVTPERLKEKLDNVTAVLDDMATRTVFTKNTQNCLKCGYFSTCYKGEQK